MDDQAFMDWLNTGNDIAMQWYEVTHPLSYPSGSITVGPRGVQAGGSVMLILLVLGAVLLLKD